MECICGIMGTTQCDSGKCDMGVCRKCAQIVVEKATQLEVSIYHKGKCTPKKFRKEVTV